MDKKKLKNGIEEILKDKGKRKFIQSVEFIVNFRAVDFSKAENRLNVDILLPHGKGHKEPKVGVIAEDEMGTTAKKAGADLIISPEQLPVIAGDSSKLKDIAENYSLLAQPNLMAQIAKNLGQYLGRRGKMPKPLIGKPEEMIKKSKRTVRIVSKGKYLPVAHVFVGTEEMSPEQLFENIEAVFDVLKKKVPEGNMKSAFVKLTMSRPVKVM
ncbi:50S ribosomal protein L1 [Candidatus Micrarchaeota archaeon]|nr:50S ribosomal protein L1 [Candidatus Micrarchaeota archaeon]